MKTFKEIYGYTNTIGTAESFDCAASALLYSLLMRLPPRSNLLEVGCEFGRSTSILAQAAKDADMNLTLVDPFVSNLALDPYTKLLAMLGEIGCRFTLHRMRTSEVPADVLPSSIDLVHIDGDHDAAGIETDCVTLLHRVRTGGFACFHDYGRESLPDVFPVVNRYMTGWESEGVMGTLGAWRKP